jgi:hypothetical protein
MTAKEHRKIIQENEEKQIRTISLQHYDLEKRRAAEAGVSISVYIGSLINENKLSDDFRGPIFISFLNCVNL